MLPYGPVQPYRKKHYAWVILLISAVFLAGALFMAFYRHQAPQEAMASQIAGEPSVSGADPVILPDSIHMGLPDGWAVTTVTPAESELWSGKLLLINQDHPVPDKAPPPNTLSIAAEGGGFIAVRSIRHSTGLEVIKALKDLFTSARVSGMKSWLVWEASRSNDQQLELQLQRVAIYARSMPLAQAAEQAAHEVPAPGYSEHQLPYVVDIRLADGWNAIPDDAPLEASADGRLLLENAWKFGFIHRYGTKTTPPYEDEAYHFRYVGVAHSTVMHALGLDLDSYLYFLHEEGDITYYEEGIPRFAILCRRNLNQPSFAVPTGCVWEGSMDNTGYAVLAVTFPPGGEEGTD